MHICFLDIDGTLVNTGGAGQAAFARTLAADFGIDPINQDVLFAGRSDRVIATDLFVHHGVDPTAENWARFQESYVEHLNETLPKYEGRVLPGVVALLEALAGRGDVALGLLTGNVREAAHRKLVFYGLWDWFPFGGFGDVQVDRNLIAADALTAAQRHLEAEPGDRGSNGDPRPGKVLVIGDTLNDITCGRAIGARCVAVPTGHTTAETLRGGLPDVLVDTLEDATPILALLDGST
jgi:phosphoglycolate phosphatase-like HAD superfamily hydrolase